MAAEAKEKKPKKEKAKAAPEAAAPEAAPAPAAPAAPAAPRPPADPRLKVLKKFHGKFLPKGVLRVRHAEIMGRWNASEDHGNVTLEELKALLADWRGTQEKPPRKPTA